MKPVAAIAISILGLAAWAQSDGELTPREVFFIKVPAKTAPPTKKVKTTTTPVQTNTPAQTAGDSGDKGTGPVGGEASVKPVAYTPLALRYSILQQKGNSFQEVDPESEFHSGDRVRVRVESNGAAYLYIVQLGSSGKWRVLFPSKDIDGGNNRIEAGHPCTIPPESGPAFYFDETAGVEKVSLVLSRSREADLEKLIYEAGDPSRANDQPQLMAQSNTIDGSVIGRVRGDLRARDLVFEKYDGKTADGAQEKAVYYATHDKSPDAMLFVDLKLTHK